MRLTNEASIEAFVRTLRTVSENHVVREESSNYAGFETEASTVRKVARGGCTMQPPKYNTRQKTTP